MVRKLAKKSTSRQKRSVHELADAGGNGRIVDVTVVVLKDGYASTAIAPIEIFHSAGVVWNWLHGETLTSAVQGADRVDRRTASDSLPALSA